MATLVLQSAGAALGSLFGPVGTILGRAAGALAGYAVDSALIGGTTVTGSRLSTARIGGASDGAVVPRLYGTSRLGGTLIWATRFEEEVTKERSGSKASSTTTKTYSYYANIALALCEGPVSALRRVWADGEELDLTDVEMRFYTGTEDQPLDPLIAAKQGEDNCPAYRGLAYVVFERLPLDDYGNRIPVLQFEVMRAVGGLEDAVRAITIIPGATEHGYATTQVTEKTGSGSSRVINRNTLVAASDWAASLDELQALCPNLESVALVVSWFGTDLRADHCAILPGVEQASRKESRAWTVGGLTRERAYLVSQPEGSPAYGGTPCDTSVREAIADLKARGLKVFLYPFVMMDIQSGNGLPDPYGGTEQAAYPWRGRITCHPAPGRAGTPDCTAATDAIVTAFLGSAKASDFAAIGNILIYGGSDSGYRRMVLHYARLAALAGGVDGFIIGSELRGLTTLRNDANRFPFVDGLMTLAEDVRAVLGQASRITYGADWSEYFGYHPADGSGDVFFHLDPLWASAAIDAVGIDNYMPLADWQDGDFTAAHPDGFVLADDRAGLQGQIVAGEGYDWYYASEADRQVRRRSAISDGLKGRHWLYRYKDLEGWWSNLHYNRFNGVEVASPTAWQPKMKPLWFTELGCAAVERAANQPNVFPDQKSSENALPYFSSGARSDAMQRRFLEAHLDWWTGGNAPAGMVDPAHIFLWTWDARPFPAFPYDTSLWTDGDNWRTGHWLNGRLGAGTLAEVIAAILTDHGFADFDVSAVTGDLPGYVQGDVASARSLIEPLLQAFLLDVMEVEGKLAFRSRQAVSLPAIGVEAFVDQEDQPLWQESRGDLADYAGQAVLGFADPAQDYEDASARSRQLAGSAASLISLSLPAVLDEGLALAAAEAQLRDHRLSRRGLTLSLAPSHLALQPGDVLTLNEGPAGRFMISRLEESDGLSLELREVAPPVPLALSVAATGRASANRAAQGFSPLIAYMDLPRFESGDTGSFARVAGFAKPWRKMVISSSATTENYESRAVLSRPASMGTLAGALAAGVSGRFDRANRMVVELAFGSFAAASQLSVLNGANLLAVLADNGVWELLSFTDASEIASGQWQLSGLLRGLYGTEDAMAAGASSGATVVALDGAAQSLSLSTSEIGLTMNLIAEAAGTTLASIGPESFTGGIRAETPLSPAHLRARRLSGGDIAISFVRRGRVDADNWTASDIPLEEESESYRLEIADQAGGLRRSVTLTSPAYTYGLLAQIADFGQAPAGLTLSVRQLGRYAAGIAASRTFSW
ncbi:baseplate multidomain protein megatron [Allorhizobium undicola]|uniref:baseplate multidomain protein megatron n=1 Tax=Allorhizobium undicola TaxID=78527 RepID=UPI00047F8D91|nr:glycoside hydrolase/phage tail family protein [Allorhizobium undicola]